MVGNISVASADDVQRILTEYYVHLKARPEQAAELYDDLSQFSHCGFAKDLDRDLVSGVKSIQHKINGLPVRNDHVVVTYFAHQPSVNNGLLINVFGHVKINHTNVSRPFAHTLLVVPSGNRFIIRNDLFCFLDHQSVLGSHCLNSSPAVTAPTPSSIGGYRPADTFNGNDAAVPESRPLNHAYGSFLDGAKSRLERPLDAVVTSLSTFDVPIHPQPFASDSLFPKSLAAPYASRDRLGNSATASPTSQPLVHAPNDGLFGQQAHVPSSLAVGSMPSVSQWPGAVGEKVIRNEAAGPFNGAPTSSGFLSSPVQRASEPTGLAPGTTSSCARIGVPDAVVTASPYERPGNHVAGDLPPTTAWERPSPLAAVAPAPAAVATEHSLSAPLSEESALPRKFADLFKSSAAAPNHQFTTASPKPIPDNASSVPTRRSDSGLAERTRGKQERAGRVSGGGLSERHSGESMEGRRIFVGRLPAGTTEAELRELFKDIHSLVNIDIVPPTGSKMGHAFVTLSDAAEGLQFLERAAEEPLKVHGSEVNVEASRGGRGDGAERSRGGRGGERVQGGPGRGARWAPGAAPPTGRSRRPPTQTR